MKPALTFLAWLSVALAVALAAGFALEASMVVPR